MAGTNTLRGNRKSAETRLRMSLAAKKRCQDPQYKEHLRANGRKVTARLIEGNKNRALPQGVSSKRGLLRKYTREARERNLGWELTEEQFETLINGDCEYCGDAPYQVFQPHYQSNGAITYNGIDRIENSIGYTISNCVPCCGPCNWWKGTLPQAKFLTQVTKIYNHQLQARGTN